MAKGVWKKALRVRSVGEPSMSRCKKKTRGGKPPRASRNRSGSGDPELQTIDGDRRRQTPVDGDRQIAIGTRAGTLVRL